jgi:hypothetical protein
MKSPFGNVNPPHGLAWDAEVQPSGRFQAELMTGGSIVAMQGEHARWDGHAAASAWRAGSLGQFFPSIQPD